VTGPGFMVWFENPRSPPPPTLKIVFFLLSHDTQLSTLSAQFLPLFLPLLHLVNFYN
jgi:hypothetical protein